MIPVSTILPILPTRHETGSGALQGFRENQASGWRHRSRRCGSERGLSHLLADITSRYGHVPARFKSSCRQSAAAEAPGSSRQETLRQRPDDRLGVAFSYSGQKMHVLFARLGDVLEIAE